MKEQAKLRKRALFLLAGVLVGGFLLRYLVIVAALPLTMVVPML